MASVSSGDRSRPSNSMPPSTIVAPTETASVEVPRPAEHRPDAEVAGPPILITATRRRFLRSSTALVAWVVPSMTWLIRRGSALLRGTAYRDRPLWPERLIGCVEVQLLEQSQKRLQPRTIH